MTPPGDFLSAGSRTCELSSVLIVEAEAGASRRKCLEDRTKAMASRGDRVFSTSCDFDAGGPWASAAALFASLLPGLQTDRPDLVERHASELIQVFPQLKKSLAPHNLTLTDLASSEEKVRNYAADRAFRNVHGLIDLLAALRAENPDSAWLIACDGFDRAGAMTSHFLRELMRRLGKRFNFTLLAGVDPGNGPSSARSFAAGAPVKIIAASLAPAAPEEMESAVAAEQAARLEELVGDHRIEKQAHLPELIRLWGLARRPDKVLSLKLFGLVVYLHLGLYADALRYGDGLLALAAKHAPGDEKLQRDIIIKTLNGLMGIQDARAAVKLIEENALPLLDHAPKPWKIDMLYLIAMVYARFLKPRNLAKGEEYLDRALAEIEQANLPPDQYHFQYVFNRNGLAMIRTFQQRFEDALQLCRDGINRLNSQVGAEKHRLHRSVLVYNIAQVYFSTGHLDESIRHYSLAMEMDPNYSEYYNERGSIFLKQGRFEEARQDYLKAIELSPPYHEVFTNLGQCYRSMGEPSLAVEAYGRSLDLEPNQVLALAGRAQAWEELGSRAAALEDYSGALALDPNQWETIAMRGVTYYENGDWAAALADFNRAIEVAPDQGGLYQNRAIVLADLGRHAEAAHDLETALRLDPAEEDKPALRSRLEEALRRMDQEDIRDQASA